MSAAVWGEVANAAMQVGTAWLNSDAQHNANRTNIRLARENREFEERMSNTAIQRRAADIEAAGGNRALAFVNGSEATTPTVSPARVEPPRFDAPRFNTAALLQKAQLDNIQAQTANTSADTKMKNTQWQILENYGQQNTAQDVIRKTQENELFKYQLDKAIAEAEISKTTAELLRDKMGAAILMLDAQARIGKINAESTEQIAAQLGVAGKDLPAVGKLLMEALKVIMSSKK